LNDCSWFRHSDCIKFFFKQLTYKFSRFTGDIAFDYTQQQLVLYVLKLSVEYLTNSLTDWTNTLDGYKIEEVKNSY